MVGCSLCTCKSVERRKAETHVFMNGPSKSSPKPHRSVFYFCYKSVSNMFLIEIDLIGYETL
jgi:hypothetical protein